MRRLAYLENRKSLGDSGTYLTDINVADPITALWVEMRATNGSTSNRGNLLADCLTRIEVVDGGKTLISLTGHEAFALAAYLLGKFPDAIHTEIPSNTSSLAFPIFFGRMLGDKTYAFDPKRYSMPQIRLQWNLAAITAVGVTGFTTATGTITYIADIMEGAAAPTGLITSKEHYAFTSAASGVEYIDLPRDNPILGFMLRAFESQVQWFSTVSNVKLNIDQGRIVPFDMRGTDFIRQLLKSGPRFVYPHVFYASDQDTLKFILKKDEHPAFDHPDSLLVVGYTNTGYGEGVLGVTRSGSSYTTDSTIDAICEGSCPFGCIYAPFGDQADPSDWLPAPNFKSVRLELTQANAGGAVAVVLRQAESY